MGCRVMVAESLGREAGPDQRTRSDQGNFRNTDNG